MSRHATYKFRLYVAGDAPNSLQAIANLTELCRTFFANHYTIEVVDVFKEPKRALVDSVFMTPTLMRVSPSPVRTIVGTLSPIQPVLEALGLNASQTGIP